MEAAPAPEAGQKFATDGYFIATGSLIDDDVLAAARVGMDAVRDGQFDTGVPPTNDVTYDPSQLCKINNAHLASRGIHALLPDSNIGQWVAALTGASMVQVFATQLLIKPHNSQAGGHVGWHQDRQYWRFWQEPGGLLTAWVALSDVTPASGPMRFVRGSHRWGFLDQGDFFGSDHEALRETIQMPDGETWEETEAVLPPGGVSFHNCLTYHGSGPNTSAGPRCSVAVHLRTQEAQPVPDEPNYYTSHLDDEAQCPVIYG